MREEEKNSIFESLKLLAPGTLLREGLENIVRAKTGALIVFNDSEEVLKIVAGGFHINSDFLPAQLYELAKMDGAIILTKDAKKIVYANTQLIPNPTVTSIETGIRHRTAERVAKQTGELVISISQRRNIITLYKGEAKYVLKDVSQILTKANQAIQTLDKYKSVLDQAMTNLSALEFEDLVNVFDVVTVLQRTEMVMKIVKEIDKYILELGYEGRLINMQLEELTNGVEEDGINVIKDYYIKTKKRNYDAVTKAIKKLSSEELLEITNISKLLGYESGINSLDINVSPKGYRILNKIPRLPSSVLKNAIEQFGTFQEIRKASIEQLDAVDGIGEIRARMIREGLRRFQEQSLLDRHI